jgi:hypothetical protein
MLEKVDEIDKCKNIEKNELLNKKESEMVENKK